MGGQGAVSQSVTEDKQDGPGPQLWRGHGHAEMGWGGTGLEEDRALSWELQGCWAGAQGQAGRERLMARGRASLQGEAVHGSSSFCTPTMCQARRLHLTRLSGPPQPLEHALLLFPLYRQKPGSEVN